jgi:S-formylglutathione hydrolase FrmB
VLNLPLVHGPVPPVLGMLAAGAVLLLLAGRGRRFRTRTLPACAAGAVLLTGLLWWLAEDVLGWWDGSFPRPLYAWAWLLCFGLLLLVPRLRSARRHRTQAACAAAAAILVLGVAVQANAAYGLFPDTASFFGPPDLAAGPITAAAGLARPAGWEAPPTTGSSWRPPPGMPDHGSVYRANIPGTVSGYRATGAYVYLPPAYLASPRRTNLPVLVLVHGLPGGPDSWLLSGNVAASLDAFASRHQGLAPVVIMPDLAGPPGGVPPLCLDSPRGHSATYLAVDVPAWARRVLGAGGTAAGQDRWAIGGLSAGGTCAAQLAATHPDVYRVFLDLSGELEPDIRGGRQAVVARYFGGDQAAFARQNAVDLLARRKYPHTSGRFVSGSSDAVYGPQLRTVYGAARGAGMDVQFQTLPGGHSWQVWSPALARNLPWLAAKLGLAG